MEKGDNWVAFESAVDVALIVNEVVDNLLEGGVSYILYKLDV